MTTAEVDYPNDDEVEAFYSDARTEALIVLAGLDRHEFEARVRFELISEEVGAIPEGEATDEDLDDVTEAYMTWARAWEELAAARAALGKRH